MRRRGFIAALCSLALPLAAHGRERRARVGYLSSHSPERFRVDVFRRALGDLGRREGDSLDLEFASADGHFERLPRLAADLASRKPDAILAVPTVAALAAKSASSIIPIVFSHVSDPIGSGLVTSVSRPEGNVTGFTHVNAGLSAKRLSLLKEAVSNLQHVAALWHPAGFDEATQREMLRETQEAGRVLGLKVTVLTVPDADALATAFEHALAGRAEAVMVLPNPVFLNARDRLVALANERALPAIYFTREFAEDGGLMSYGADATEMVRGSAAYIDRILRGQSPGELPVQSATKFDLVINAAAARGVRLGLPPTLLAQADEVIE
jgi:putative tryptophan/tyrosine transport system substrate-binding protein